MATSRKRQPARNPAELIVDRIKSRMEEAAESVPRIPGHHRQLLEAWLSAFPEGWYSIPKPSGNTPADFVRSEMLINGITDFLVAERGLLVCCSIVKVVWPSGSFIGKLDWCGMPFDEALKQAATNSGLWPVDVEPNLIRHFRDHCLVRKNLNVDSVQNNTIEKLNGGEFVCHPPQFMRFSECDRANEEAPIRKAAQDNPPFVGENKTAVVESEAAAQRLGTPESVPASFQSLLDWGKQQRVHPMQQVLQNALLNALATNALVESGSSGAAAIQPATTRKRQRRTKPRMTQRKVEEHWQAVMASENRNLIQEYLTLGEIDLAKKIGCARNTLREVEAIRNRGIALREFNRQNG